MSSERKSSFCAIFEEKTESSVWNAAIISSSVEAVKNGIDRALKQTAADEESVDQSVDQEEEDENNSLTKLGLDLRHFYRELKKYYELAQISSGATKVFPRSFFTNVVINLCNEYRKVETYNGKDIYEVNDAELSEINRNLARLRDIEEGTRLLSPAVLLSIVASYDWLFAELAKSLLKLRPERYHSSDRQYTVSEILGLGSLEEVVDRVINDEVDTLMNKSHIDQVLFFEKSFSVDVKSGFDNWSKYIEIFERRNLAAHGGLCVSERYLSICSKNGLDVSSMAIGDDLSVDADYLNASLDVLIEFGTKLVLSAWQKQIPTQKNESFSTVITIGYDLIKERRYRVAESIMRFALERYAKGAADSTIKMLTVNLAIAKKKLDDVDGSRSTINSQDWSASSPVFRICVAAVLEEIDNVCDLFGAVTAGNGITATEFREWPAFDWVRSDAKFAELFERTFKEPLIRSDTVTKMAAPGGPDPEEKDNGGDNLQKQ